MIPHPPLLIEQKSSYLAVHILLALSAASSVKLLLGGATSPADIMVPATVCAVAVVGAWANFIKSKRSIEIDIESRAVTIHKTSALLRPKRIEYPLDRFGSVRSYMTAGRYPKSVVELVTKEGGRALMVAFFEPDSKAKSFMSIPAEVENKEAAALREKIASLTNLRDSGYLGEQYVGAQMKE